MRKNLYIPIDNWYVKSTKKPESGNRKITEGIFDFPRLADTEGIFDFPFRYGKLPFTKLRGKGTEDLKN